ncbi:MAG: TIM barrel protein [Fimbriimonas sp.]|nr:TIM barrel protein [Fimbriimonas sp.]
MRFGVCCGLDDAPTVLAAGYDYVELGASGLSDDTALYAGLPVEATNLFFPGSIKLFGPDATPYLDLARATVDRAAKLGVQTMVIGSGASRTSPAGVNLEWSEREFTLVAAAVAHHAKQYGITIAPESLNRTETNVGNDLGCLARGLKAAGVGYTADSFHILYEWHANFPNEATPSQAVWEDQMPLAPNHVHIADLPRFAPKPGDPMVEGFANRLLELGYDGRISLEYRRSDDFADELKRTLDGLRILFKLP